MMSAHIAPLFFMSEVFDIGTLNPDQISYKNAS